MNTTAKSKGMTLVEIMVAASIGLIVVTVGLRFVIQTLKSYQYETGKLLNQPGYPEIHHPDDR